MDRQRSRASILPARFLVAILASIVIALPPVTAQAALQEPPEQCFAETGLCVRGRFLAYWLEHGGLALNGLPLTGELVDSIDGASYTVQYFERARFEYHPENAPPFDVLLGQAGRALHPPAAPADPQPEATYFAETGHNVGGVFLDYWQGHGGLAQFGFPLSEEFDEPDPATGQTYRAQYFERARFEYHPETRPPYDLLLGQLGRFLLAQRPSYPAVAPCNAGLTATPPGFAQPELLAWASHQIVSGTIVEQLPPVARPLGLHRPPDESMISTDYVLQVDGRLRGQPYERVHVRRLGGTLGDCTHYYDSEPKLVVGQRLLLFLGSPATGTGVPTYWVAGGMQGYWTLSADGTVIPVVGRYRAYSGMPVARFNDVIRMALLNTPPTNLGPSLVPLDQAPLAPASAAPR